MVDYLPRVADRVLTDALHAMGAVLIEGPKGCGKTATARQLAGSEILLDLDPEAERRAALDPRLILDGSSPRLLDEWQRAPRLWDAVRRAVDDRGGRGHFILTGSATPNDDVPRHSGAGRISVLRMRTMTLTEKAAVATPGVSVAALLTGEDLAPTDSPLSIRDYLYHIAVGGWPSLVGADERTARTFLNGYLDIIVERDMDETSGGRRDPRLVRRFLHAYAQMIAQPAHLAAIARRAHDVIDPGDTLSRRTGQLYLDALRRMMIVDDVAAWDPSVRSAKRLTATPKRHLCDPSLATALLQMTPDRMLGDLGTTGFLFESLVAHELRVYAEAANAALYHYREAEGRLEIDYVLETRDGEWVGVEVKLGERGVDAAATALRRLADRVTRPPKSLVVVTATSLAYTREDGVHVVPLGTLGP